MIQAIILAGGLGTRLQSVVAEYPKALAPVCNRPFLTYLLNQLISEGFEEVILCTGYRGNQIQETLGKTYGNLRLTYSLEKEPLGTAGALRWACSQIHSDPCLVMNGDSFFKSQTSLKDFIDWHCKVEAQASLILTQLLRPDRYGLVDFLEDGRVIAFLEKSSPSPLETGWINTGIYCVNQKLIEAIEWNKPLSLEYDIFPGWIEKGFYGYRAQGIFLDIGTPESYALAQEFFNI